MKDLSRREFVAASSAFVSSVALGQTGSSSATKLTAGEVIERIKKNVGVPWREKTVDHLLTGSPDTPVQGIASTMMATLDVVERCAAQGKNMIVTHETPFYLHQDITDDIKDDSVLQYKLDFCRKHEIAIFHFHDHWHARHPDGIAEGMVRQLGWKKNVNDPANPKKLTFDGVPLAQFVQQMARTLKAHTIRVLGDPSLPVKRVQTSWGYCGREGGIKIFSQPDVDVLICGETREWELVEYCQDSIKAGNRKALVVVGHVMSEQGGMILCADWLKTFISEVSIQFIPAAEPFWNPDHPLKA
ncbi:MAG: Nif3-like dinuclear metal center hexameric protein [Edaphobacter sp.]